MAFAQNLLDMPPLEIRIEGPGFGIDREHVPRRHSGNDPAPSRTVSTGMGFRISQAGESRLPKWTTHHQIQKPRRRQKSIILRSRRLSEARDPGKQWPTWRLVLA